MTSGVDQAIRVPTTTTQLAQVEEEQRQTDQHEGEANTASRIPGLPRPVNARLPEPARTVPGAVTVDEPPVPADLLAPDGDPDEAPVPGLGRRLRHGCGHGLRGRRRRPGGARGTRSRPGWEAAWSPGRSLRVALLPRRRCSSMTPSARVVHEDDRTGDLGSLLRRRRRAGIVLGVASRPLARAVGVRARPEDLRQAARWSEDPALVDLDRGRQRPSCRGVHDALEIRRTAPDGEHHVERRTDTSRSARRVRRCTRSGSRRRWQPVHSR